MTKQPIPIKPEDVTWTDDQWKAIAAKGQDILVAAAAGSGKTAVLVERIIRKVIDETDPLNVDELLVVTFTNAAAAEMRSRIGAALEKEIAANPASHHLRKQLSLLNKASISTLHSFCLEVIRKYYYLIDLDPAFRIADSTEGLLLRDEVLDDLFEEEYGKDHNEEFYRLVDTFSNDRSDDELQQVVGKLYDFSQSHPNPDQWLQQLADMYDVDETSTVIDELPFIDALKFDIQLQLESAAELLDEAMKMTEMPGGPVPRIENFKSDLAIVTRMQNAAHSWQSLYEEMQFFKFGTLKTCKGADYDPELTDQSKKLRDQVKKIVNTLKEDYFTRKPESYLRDMREMKDVISSLTELVRTFAAHFKEMKKEKGLVDFGDLEHYTLAILSETGTGGGLVPSEAALAYQRQFKEILLDEYQDVNMVQESIVRLVTTGEEESGNLFMVGDVKQSIYRFRLAEPNLFLSKYKRFSPSGETSGLRIDLAKNFRSRGEVLSGTNFLFKQIMSVKVGEIDYDEAAELVKGASYPEEKTYPVEVAIIDQQLSSSAAVSDEEDSSAAEIEDLEQSQLEARWMAKKIKQMVESRQPVYDAKSNTERPIQYRDIVILLRSMPWAAEIMEEFKRAGIPIYASLSNGYFQSMEVAVMVSLLKVIDNPFQDIPLASVLRSPIVRCSENDLAIIRLASKKGTYYEAVKAFLSKSPEEDQEELHEKVSRFVEKLADWRALGRQGALADLVWQLYRDTHFYDFVGGMPGGKQRQANLRALHDRARQYEETSFRGLFRFLRFVERMQERGEDLAAARALSEQEDVIRLMTIHSSKGLEFPFVFVAGLGRQFNMMDLRNSLLLDKDYGLASKYINIDKRISYPSLPQMAFKRKKRLELLSEEMRVLYVALTRAKEKLFLLGTVKNAEKSLVKWEKAWNYSEWLLGDADRASAMTFLDWIGPALVRHNECDVVAGSNPLTLSDIIDHPSCWSVYVTAADELVDEEAEADEAGHDWLEHLKQNEPMPIESGVKKEIEERLSWVYPNGQATALRSKQSVSDLKRMNEIYNEGSSGDLTRSYQRPIFNRPKFMQEKTLSPAEIGTAVHTVMQHVSLMKKPSLDELTQFLESLVQRELLTEEQAQVIDQEKLTDFFDTEIGQFMLQADRVYRETPFNMGVSASEVSADWKGPDEVVLVQGVIDCLIEKDEKLYLLDYKTDTIAGRFANGFEEAEPILRERYRLQIDLYARAVEQIWKRKVDGKYLFFFDGAHLVKVD
ncbi:ATP-dependent helicase/nuclease subunit A [Bacillus ectoiniformans]|uniref:helicase-exonuclease AddAB subunit AddA n=1 Tax=Bacillus ectoiniformans TaxID=1494429 RepID=UPI00195C0405|nr:helicase-exonuclease AddAB subunit AddA [Bacillus ectoiniformans]MBM7647581.1 ATP-dependent helicase/nuclease subunit A [Bacillus ectoiniformans]